MSIKKKSKYKSANIKKKRYYFYEIIWEDILGDSGHSTAWEFEKMKPAIMVSNAYLFKKSKKYVHTFASYDASEESFSDRNVFPKGCIKSMKKILRSDNEKD
tara:strand:- start:198 stop:503 length:306 start_codon:yes stop_codon:yes gene_type:complete